MGEESPKNKVKFLCSYAGKVLPRPSDGLLKYVGGETRVICVPRDVTLSEMMKKVSGMIDGEVVLKYQLVPEDLDTLVSVRTEDDLKHMIEEHDRQGTGGGGGSPPLLRAFLFPSKPLLMLDNNNLQFQYQQQQQQQPTLLPLPMEPYMLEQRYIDAINGIIRTSPRARSSSSKFTSYSACCSPKSNSPDGHSAVESPFYASSPQMMSASQSPNIIGAAAAGGSTLGRVATTMHKVRSSPSPAAAAATSTA